MLATSLKGPVPKEDLDFATVVDGILSKLTIPYWNKIEWVVFPEYRETVVRLKMYVLDRDNQQQTFVQRDKYILNERFRNDHRGILDWAYDMVKTMYIHELDEQLYLDGQRWRDPHQ